MPSSIKLISGWLIAALFALLLSWNAVAQVRNRVIRPSIEIPTTVVAGAASITAIPTTEPTVIRVEPEIGDATTQPDTTEAQPGSTAAASGESTSTTTGTPSTTTAAPAATTTTTQPPTTTTAPPPTTTQPPVTTTTTTEAPAETQTSSYTLTGGVVTISYSPGTVTFVSAIPQPGYATEQRETGPERVRIRFESETHTSDFRAEWQGDELQITQNETGDDD